MNKNDKVEVGQCFESKDGGLGKIVMFFGNHPHIEKIYGDMFPGAEDSYEYITMWDETAGRVELRALNKYFVEDITIITKESYDLQIKKYFGRK